MATIFKDINDNSMIIDDGLYDTFDDALLMYSDMYQETL